MKTVILSLEIAFILVEVIAWHLALKRLLNIEPGRRLKPFDCFACLSMWICLGLVFVPDFIIEKAFLVASTAVLGQGIGKLLTEWKIK